MVTRTDIREAGTDYRELGELKDGEGTPRRVYG